MTALLLKPFLALGLGECAAKGLAILLAVVAVLGALWWLRSDVYSDGRRDERGEWEAARAEANAEAAQLKARADEAAARSRVSDRVRAVTEANELKEAVDEAVGQGRDPRAAYYECVRLQQSAREAGRPAPVC